MEIFIVVAVDPYHFSFKGLFPYEFDYRGIFGCELLIGVVYDISVQDESSFQVQRIDELNEGAFSKVRKTDMQITQHHGIFDIVVALHSGKKTEGLLAKESHRPSLPNRLCYTQIFSLLPRTLDLHPNRLFVIYQHTTKAHIE